MHRRTLKLVLFWCAMLALPLVLWAATGSDDFNRADVLNNLGANWTFSNNTGNNFQIISNNVAPYNSETRSVYWNATTFSADQYSQLVVVATDPTNSEFMGPAVRINASAVTGYVVFWGASGITTLELDYVIAGARTFLGSSTTPSPGDIIRLEVSGTSLTVKKNGSAVIGPITDAQFATGQPGIMGFGFRGPVTGVAADTWEGGDLSAGPAHYGTGIVWKKCSW